MMKTSQYLTWPIFLDFCLTKPCLNQTLSKPKTCVIQTDFTVPSTKYLCNLNLCKPNTCLNWTNSSASKGFGIDMFYCIRNKQIKENIDFVNNHHLKQNRQIQSDSLEDVFYICFLYVWCADFPYINYILLPKRELHCISALNTIVMAQRLVTDHTS